MINMTKHICKILMLVLATVCAPPSLETALTYTYTMGMSELDIHDVKAPDGTIYTRISGSDMVGSGEVGHPELPYKVVRFLVPDDSSDFSVTVEAVDGIRQFPLLYPLYPVQESVSINDYSEDQFTYGDSHVYQSLNSTFKAAILEEMRIEGRYHVISIGLWPCAWSGKDQRLDMCKTMQISIDYKEEVGSMHRITKKSASQNKGFVNIADLVVNADAVPQPMNLDVWALDPSYQDEVLPRYYIISEKELLPACEDLALWKTQKGYVVIRKAIEDIYNDPRYKVGSVGVVDEAASLRKYLQDEFAEHGTFFCLLIGDHRTKMPIRKAYSKNDFSTIYPDNGDRYIPTDAYFANLSNDNWIVYRDPHGIYVSFLNNDPKNNPFVSNVSFDPYIYLGRLLCHSAEEIKNYTSKLLLYESNPGRGNSEYLNKSLISMQYDGFTKVISEDTFPVVSEMNNTFDSVEWLRDTVYANNSLTHCYPTGDIMLKKINQNGYSSLMGHGEPTTIACSGEDRKYETWEYIKALEVYRAKVNDNSPYESGIPYQCDNCGLDLMDNYDRPSVIYTLSCSTAPFDIYDIFDVPHNMASSFTCGGKYGGVAYLGNTRSGYWTTSSRLEKAFLSVLNTNTVLGIAESLSKVKYTGDQEVQSTHNLIGDPEFRLWLRSPSELSVSVCWEDKLLISGYDASGCTIVQNDGEGNLRKRTLPDMLSTRAPVGYSSNGKMKAVGIFKEGFLPQVRIECFDDYLMDCNKKFMVRSADIGKGYNKSVIVGSNANIDIKAVDYISAGQEFSIEANGNVNLRCDKNIELEGSKVEAGGQLSLAGEMVVLSGGFSVKMGGSLSVQR